MENKLNNRIQWIDLVRAIAIICVLFCHSTEGVYLFRANYMADVNTVSKLFAFTIFTIGRLGVPLFLMITGYLLLDRDYDSEKCQSFWKNKWLHLLIVTEIWFLSYELFIHFYTGKELELKDYLWTLLFIRIGDMSHMWYMPMIIGLYILIPFVAIALKKIDVKLLAFPTIIFSIFGFFFPVYVEMLATQKELILPQQQFYMGFSGGCYGLFLVFGYLIKKGCFKKIKSIFLILIFGLSLAGAIYFQLWTYKNERSYNIWYESPFVLFMSLSLFELCSRIKKVYFYIIIKFVSYYSFAVYLIHNFVLTFVLPKVIPTGLMQPVKVIITIVSGLVISLAVAWIINHIPKVGKYLLYNK